MKKVRLNNGVIMPSIGFGVYQIPSSETERCVSDALEVGYRSIDTVHFQDPAFIKNLIETYS